LKYKAIIRAVIRPAVPPGNSSAVLGDLHYNCLTRKGLPQKSAV